MTTAWSVLSFFLFCNHMNKIIYLATQAHCVTPRVSDTSLISVWISIIISDNVLWFVWIPTVKPAWRSVVQVSRCATSCLLLSQFLRLLIHFWWVTNCWFPEASLVAHFWPKRATNDTYGNGQLVTQLKLLNKSKNWLSKHTYCRDWNHRLPRVTASNI